MITTLCSGSRGDFRPYIASAQPKRIAYTIVIMFVVVCAVSAAMFFVISNAEHELVERVNNELELYIGMLEERILSEDFQTKDLLEEIRANEAPSEMFRRLTFWIIPVSSAFTVLIFSGIIGRRDYRRLKKTKDDLMQTQRLYLKSLSNTNTTFFDYDANSGRIIFSEMFSKRHGVPEMTSTDNHGLDNLEINYNDNSLPFGSLLNDIENGSDIPDDTFCMKSVDGDLVWYSISITNIFNQKGVLERALALVRDITAEKESENNLKSYAERDAMTGLYNKMGGIHHINNIIKNNTDSLHALFVLDLDNFKSINDTLGHAAGDTAIMDAALILNGLFRQTDILCRFGGDEFVALMPNISNENFAIKKADEICEALRRNYGEGKNKVNISSSIGIAVFPSHGHSYEELFINADSALYKAKENGKNTYSLFKI